MGTIAQEHVTLKRPAETFDALRAQASLLAIHGRGRMNKAQLAEAVAAGIDALREQVNAASADVAASHVVHGDAATHVRVEVSPFVASVVSAAPGQDIPRTTRGTGLLRTRAGRIDYPARKRTRKGKRR